MAINHRIGLHVSIQENLTETARMARDMGLRSFQFFLVPSGAKDYFTITDEDREGFLKLRRDLFDQVYIHAAYWSNLASGKPNVRAVSKKLLAQEIKLATSIEADYIVLHPGSGRTQRGPNAHRKGIEQLTRYLKEILDKTPGCGILLENSPHAGESIGGSLDDFAVIRELLGDHPRIRYCFDTAHAYAYGLQLEDTETLVKYIDKTMGIDNLELIHFNDTTERFGARKDRHAAPGEGLIGKETLLRLANHPRLVHIPLLIEMPSGYQEKSGEVLEQVKKWWP